MAKTTSEPLAGGTTAPGTFNDLKAQIAARNEAAHKEARKLRVERDRAKLLIRRRQDLM
jgi:hypothetical protein